MRDRSCHTIQLKSTNKQICNDTTATMDKLDIDLRTSMPGCEGHRRRQKLYIDGSETPMATRSTVNVSRGTTRSVPSRNGRTALSWPSFKVTLV
jgi:hypothetical protein